MCACIYNVHDSRQSEKYADEPGPTNDLSQEDKMDAEKEQPDQPYDVKDVSLLQDLLFAA